MTLNNIRSSKNNQLSDLPDVLPSIQDGQSLVFRNGTQDWSGQNVPTNTSFSGLSGTVSSYSGFISGISGSLNSHTHSGLSAISGTANDIWYDNSTVSGVLKGFRSSSGNLNLYVPENGSYILGCDVNSTVASRSGLKGFTITHSGNNAYIGQYNRTSGLSISLFLNDIGVLITSGSIKCNGISGTSLAFNSTCNTATGTYNGFTLDTSTYRLGTPRIRNSTFAYAFEGNMYLDIVDNGVNIVEPSLNMYMFDIDFVDHNTRFALDNNTYYWMWSGDTAYAFANNVNLFSGCTIGDFGSGKNVATFDDQGRLTLLGNARVIKNVILTTKEMDYSGTTAPAEVYIDAGTSGLGLLTKSLAFSTSAQNDVYFTIPCPPDSTSSALETVDIFFTNPTLNATSGQNVLWKLVYCQTIDAGGAGLDGIMGVSSINTLSGNYIIGNGTTTSGAKKIHKLTISGFALNYGYTNFFHLYRDVANDNLADTANLLYVGFNYISTKLGSGL